MKFLSKIIAVAVIVSVAGACGRDSRNGADTQNEKPKQPGLGAGVHTSNESPARNTSTTQDGTNTNSNQATSTTQFVLTAADGGLLEVRLGELAAKNGSSAKIKEFGRTMVIDHQKANSELKNLANGLNISIPDALNRNCQIKYDEIAQKKGNDFDTAYANMMVSSHQETIALFRAASNGGEHQNLQEWAESKIPNLEHHLQMAQMLKDGAISSHGQ